MNVLDSIIPPGTGGIAGDPLNIILNQLFWGGLVIAVVLAVVMVIVGAIQYMTTDAFSGKEEGKGKIKAALGGLVLAFSTIILLNTINPNLTSFELRFMPLNLQRTQTGGGQYENQYRDDSALTPNESLPPISSGFTEEALREYFLKNGININHGPCPPGQTKGCTNVQGLGESAVLGVVKLKRDSGADITITGGTEDGHQTHGVGKPIVDLRKNTALDSYIKSNAVNTRQQGVWVVYEMSDGTTFMEESTHWHVVFK